MKIHSDSLDQEVRIEIVPLIDVIFCILTFFILAALTLSRQTAINVDLPKASTGATQMREMLIVSLEPSGQIYIDQQPVTSEQLRAALLNYHQTKPEGLMVLYASPLSGYDSVIQVLDVLRSVGGDRVALATQPNPAPATQPQVPNQPQVPGSIPGLDNQTNPYGSFNTPGSLNQPASGDSYNPSQQLFPSVEPLPTQPGGTSGLTKPNPAPTVNGGRSTGLPNN